MFEAGSTSTARFSIFLDTSGRLTFQRTTTGTNLVIRAYLTDFPAFSVGAWFFVGFSYDRLSPATVYRMVLGDERMLATEPHKYDLRQKGTTTWAAATGTANIGNGQGAAPTTSWQGKIAAFAMVGAAAGTQWPGNSGPPQMTIPEMQAWQINPATPVRSCFGRWELPGRGNQGGTAYDLSGGGWNGTMSGATISNSGPNLSRLWRVHRGRLPLYSAIDETNSSQTDHVRLAAGAAAYKTELGTLSTPPAGRVRLELDAEWEP
jgi:hypothetical protein